MGNSLAYNASPAEYALASGTNPREIKANGGGMAVSKPAKNKKKATQGKKNATSEETKDDQDSKGSEADEVSVLLAMRAEDLKVMLRKEGLSTAGAKKVMVERLVGVKRKSIVNEQESPKLLAATNTSSSSVYMETFFCTKCSVDCSAHCWVRYFPMSSWSFLSSKTIFSMHFIREAHLIN